MLINNSTLMSGQALGDGLMQYYTLDDDTTLPLHRYKRHKTFVNPPTVLQICSRAEHFLPNQESACNFVANYPSCTDIVQRINYLKLFICYLNMGINAYIHLRMIAISLLIIAIYTLFAYVVGKYFILPNVIYIASYINVPSFEYGVTTIGVLLAAPDLIFHIAVCAKYSANGTLILSGMVGRALSCYAIGMAVIAFHQQQCRLPGNRFTCYLLMILAANVFTIVSLYYKLDNDSHPPDEQNGFEIKYCASFMIIFYVTWIVFVIILSRRSSRRRTEFEEIVARKTYLKVAPSELKGIRLLTYPLNPFNNVALSRWRIAIMSPFWILSALQVPVVDPHRPLSGWSKYLACTSILIFPWHFWMLKVQDSFLYTTLALSVIVTCGLFIFTRAKKPPRNHGLFAIVGVIIGFSLFHVIDLEVNILLYQVFAFSVDLQLDVTSAVAFSTCFIIFTVIISDSLMKMQHPNLASGIVVGISLNQSFTALPCVIFQHCYDLHTQVSVSPSTMTCYVFLLVTIAVSLISALLTKFHWRPAHGAFLITFYIFFLVFSFLGGYYHLHPYGAHHTVSAIFEIEHAEWA